MTGRPDGPAGQHHAAGRDDTVLQTCRLRLRRWRDGDADTFYAHLNTPAVMAHLGGVQDRATFDAAHARILECEARHGHCFWIAERLEDGGHLAGELIGFIGLKRVNADGTDLVGQFEIGWRLRQDAWGRGYAYEGAAAARDAAFARYNAPDLLALTFAANSASRTLMGRLGLVHVAALDFDEPRYGGRYGMTMVHRMTRAEWDRTDGRLFA